MDNGSVSSRLSGVDTPSNNRPFAHILRRGTGCTNAETKVISGKMEHADIKVYGDSLQSSSASDQALLLTEEIGEEKEEDEVEALLRGRRLYLALAGLDALLFIAALDLTIIATVYVEIANSFNALGRAEWTVTSYMLAATAIQPLYGKFSDILGRAEAIIVAVLLFVVGSILCATSHSMDMLIASRAVQGLGGGGIMSLIFIVVADVLSERERGKYIGVFTCTWGLASAVAPMLGGLIVQHADWRLIFWINLPFCAVAMIFVLFFMMRLLPRPATSSLKAKARKIDFVG
ncbi:hypothetical protein IWW38_003203, partial [Coemansia aciculifera]